MKTIGLLGGMSWESTESYYRIINETVKKQLGGFNSAKICLYSVNFAEIETLQHQGEWQKCADILSQAAQSIEKGGADFLLICTNTMHKVSEQIARQLTIPLLHIADATAERLLEDGFNKVGLLGTQFTMQESFYKGRLKDEFAIDVIVPTIAQQQTVHSVIYQELCQGKVIEASRQAYLEIIRDLYNSGAQAVILGCTEIPLLLQQSDTKVPLYDTTLIHAQAAVARAI